MACEGNECAGFGRLTSQAQIGRGAERFGLAVDRLLTWRMHERSGLSVAASSPHIVVGTVAILRLGVGPWGVNAPVRVIDVIDEPRRQGFAYGTLPGHPESGEEWFVLQRRDNDAIDFSITAMSRPATVMARLGGRVTRTVQSRMTARYLTSV